MTERQIIRRQYRDARANLRHVCWELGIDHRHFRLFDPRIAAPVLASVLHYELMRYKDLPEDLAQQPWSWED